MLQQRLRMLVACALLLFACAATQATAVRRQASAEYLIMVKPNTPGVCDWLTVNGCMTLAGTPCCTSCASMGLGAGTVMKAECDTGAVDIIEGSGNVVSVSENARWSIGTPTGPNRASASVSSASAGSQGPTIASASANNGDPNVVSAAGTGGATGISSAGTGTMGIAYSTSSYDANCDLHVVGAFNTNTLNLACPWHLTRINQRFISPSWDDNCDMPGDGSGVDIYVVDTGVTNADNQFGDRLSGFWPNPAAYPGFTDALNPLIDQHGHGTFVAGIAAGKDYGVARGARIKAVKVFLDGETTDLATIISALDYILLNRTAADIGRPAIVSMSLSGSGNYQLIDWLIAALLANNVLVVTAAGNADAKTGAADACQFSPGSAAASLTVGATDSFDRLTWWSNYGPCVKVLAPGRDIYSVWNNGTHMTLSGTSMATPIVSGAAALLWQQGFVNGMTAKQVFRGVIEQAYSDPIVVNSVSVVDQECVDVSAPLPTGTPGMLVNTQFSVLPASPADLVGFPGGAPLTPCIAGSCPNVAFFTTQAFFASGQRRLARATNGATGNKVYASDNSGSSWWSANTPGLTASRLGLLTTSQVKWTGSQWSCTGSACAPGLYLGTLSFGIPSFYSDDSGSLPFQAVVVHADASISVVIDFAIIGNGLYLNVFKATMQTLFGTIINPRNVASSWLGWTNNALTPLTASQSVLLFSWLIQVLSRFLWHSVFA